MHRPSIRQYTSLTAYLNAVVGFEKSRTKQWTLSRWAKDLDLKDTSSITKVLKGQRSLGVSVQEKIISFLSLPGDEANFFRALVQLDKVKGAKAQVDAMDVLRRAVKLKPRVHLGPNDKHLVIYKNWFSAIIRELCSIPNLKVDAAKLSTILRPSAGLAVVERVVADFLKAQILNEKSDGSLVAGQAAVESPTDVPVSVIRRFHRQGLELAKDAIESVPMKEREFQMVAFPVPVKRMPEMKKMIREFKEKLIEEFELKKDFQKAPYAVYQMHLCLFPVTHTIANNHIQEGYIHAD